VVRARPLALAAALPVAALLAHDARTQAGGAGARGAAATRAADARRPDSAAVHAAVDDYVGALYDVAPARVRRSVSPALAKYGYAADSTGRYTGMAMTYDELVALAGRYNRAGRVPPSAPRAVTVYDVQDQTASAKLTAHWGTDYLLLARQDGAWRVTHVLWQSRPHAASAAAR
jgi:hypothetical protein